MTPKRNGSLEFEKATLQYYLWNHLLTKRIRILLRQNIPQILVQLVEATRVTGFLGGSAVKNPSADAGDKEDPQEKEMETHSSILAWEIPWTEGPGGPQSTGSQRAGHDLATEQHQQVE